jgi:hypothetical protein
VECNSGGIVNTIERSHDVHSKDDPNRNYDERNGPARLDREKTEPDSERTYERPNKNAKPR